MLSTECRGSNPPVITVFPLAVCYSDVKIDHYRLHYAYWLTVCEQQYPSSEKIYRINYLQPFLAKPHTLFLSR